MSAWYSAAPYGALDDSGYYLEDGSECCLAFGIDWQEEITADTVKITPIIYRYDKGDSSYPTNNYGGYFEETLTEPSGDEGSWIIDSFYNYESAPTAGTFKIDDFETRTYQRESTDKTIVYRIYYHNAYNYFYGNVGDNDISFGLTIPAKSNTSYVKTIDHYAFGFEKNEGNNWNKTAFQLNTTSFTLKKGQSRKIDSSLAISIQNLKGFQLRNSYHDYGAAADKALGTTYTQGTSDAGFEFRYDPVSYTISYNLNGATNNSSNPTSYNVLYGKSFANPTAPTGKIFAGWYVNKKDSNNNTVRQYLSGVNEDCGDNTFSNQAELGNILSPRMAENITLKAELLSPSNTVQSNTTYYLTPKSSSKQIGIVKDMSIPISMTNSVLKTRYGTNGTYYKKGAGETNDTTGYCISQRIPCFAGEKIEVQCSAANAYSGWLQCVAYDDSGNIVYDSTTANSKRTIHVNGVAAGSKIIATAPTGAKYIRFAYVSAQKDRLSFYIKNVDPTITYGTANVATVSVSSDGKVMAAATSTSTAKTTTVTMTYPSTGRFFKIERNFTIAVRKDAVAPFSVKTGLKYTGSNQQLINSSTVVTTYGAVTAGVTTSASTAPSTWVTYSNVTAKNVGTYYVWWKTAGNATYAPGQGYLSTSIGKGTQKVTLSLMSNITYDGAKHQVINSYTHTGNGKVYFSLSASSTTQPTIGWFETVEELTVSEAADYYVWYKCDSTTEYNAISPTYFSKVTINKADSVIELRSSGGESISSITMTYPTTSFVFYAHCAQNPGGVSATSKNTANFSVEVIDNNAPANTDIGFKITGITYGTESELLVSVPATNNCNAASITIPVILNKGTLTGSASISGKNVVGQILTAVVSNPNNATLTYTWEYRLSQNRPPTVASTTNTCLITKAMIDTFITLTVKAKKNNYFNKNFSASPTEAKNDYEKPACFDFALFDATGNPVQNVVYVSDSAGQLHDTDLHIYVTDSNGRYKSSTYWKK